MKNIAVWGFSAWLALVGCGKSDGEPAASNGGSGGSGGATGGTGGSSSSSAGIGGDGPCFDAARAALAESCDFGRVCNYKGYATDCTSGDADVTEAVYACVRGCQTVFDPGDDNAVACLESAIAGKRTTTTTTVETTVAKLCDDDYSARGFGIISVMGGPTHAEKLASCLAAASTCSAAYDCWGDTGAGLVLSPECS